MRDFRALVATQVIHPCFIVLPCVDRPASEESLRLAIACLTDRDDPMVLMVNHILKVSSATEMILCPLPSGES